MRAKNKANISTLVRYHELHLKSEPVKRSMLKQLKKNIQKTAKEKVEIIDGRLVIDSYNKKIHSILQKTFGVASFSPVLVVEKSMKSIEKASAKLMKGFSKKKTFKIEAMRADKRFPCTSQQIKQHIGEIFFNKGQKVRMKNPDKLITIEIRDKAYVYDTIYQGPGGMPVGTAGYFASELKNQKDMLAVWFMMKRGAFPVLTGKPNKTMKTRLESWASGRKIKVADKIRINAVVTSETDIKKLNKLPKQTLAPLVAFNNMQIKNLSSQI